MNPRQWLLDQLWNRLRKSAQSNLGEKGWTCYYGGNRGISSWICPQASKLCPAPRPVYKMTTPEERPPSETQAPGVGLSRQPGLKVPGGPHTRSHSNYTCGTLGINNCGGPMDRFSFAHWGNFLCAHWSPWSAFLLIQYCNGTVWMSQTLLCQWSFKWQLGLCAVFSRVSNHTRVSLTPSREGYTKQGPGLCFHEYGTISF